MSDVTRDQFETLMREMASLKDGQRDIHTDVKALEARMDKMDVKVAALPDKAAIYTASLAIHGLIWGTIISTIMMLNTFGAFR